MRIECFNLLLYLVCGTATSFNYRAMDGNAGLPNSTSKISSLFASNIEHKIKEAIAKQKIKRRMCETFKRVDMCSDKQDSRTDRPKIIPTKAPAPTSTTTEPPKTTKGNNLSLVFSEPSEFSNDTSCMKFKLPSDRSYGRDIRGADLIVHITNRRTRSGKTNKKRKRRKGKTRRKISIKVSWLDPVTQEKRSISRLRFRPAMDKNKKWKKISLPFSVLKAVKDGGDNTLNLCIECKRCNRKTQIILPLKTNKKRLKFINTRRRKGKKPRENGAKAVKLRKNRPFLLCRTPDRSSYRKRRETTFCSNDSPCCRREKFIPFRDIGLSENIAYPDGFLQTECVGSCSKYETITNSTTKNCTATKFKSLEALLILDNSVSILDIPNAQIERCGCK